MTDKCRGQHPFYPNHCDSCNLFMDSCDGAEGWGDYNGQWLELDEIERLVEAEIAEDEYKSKFRED